MAYSVDYTLWRPLSFPSPKLHKPGIADTEKCVTCQTLAISVRHLERLDNWASQLDLLMYFRGKEILSPCFARPFGLSCAYFTGS